MGLPDIIPCNFVNAIIEPEKVIAPKVWYGPAANIDESDIVPETWERI